MNKERYNQIIDEAYENYSKMVWKITDIPLYSKEEFTNKCKTDPEFSEKWGLNIDERELRYEERIKLYEEKTNLSTTYILSVKETLDKHNIPTRLITITYKDTIIESYE